MAGENPAAREAGRAEAIRRLSGETRPGRGDRAPRAALRAYRSSRGDAPRKAPCVMSLFRAMGAHPGRQTASADLPRPRGRPGNSRAQSRTAVARGIATAGF